MLVMIFESYLFKINHRMHAHYVICMIKSNINPCHQMLNIQHMLQFYNQTIMKSILDSKTYLHAFDG